MPVYELNLDGLVAPSHHYGGLAIGNLASTLNAHQISNPQEAARQGLAKMRFMHNMGLKQGLLPPHQRPNLHLLYQLGFSGSPSQQIEKVSRTAPELLSACYSAACMWVANAATVSSSLDSADNRVHFTAANLVSNFHRSQEAAFSSKLLKTIFNNPKFFTHHSVLPKSITICDEGAANHSRLCANHHESGVNLFVYGKQALSNNNQQETEKFPARQTREASQAIARSHHLNANNLVFAQQNPQVIEAGVFHNDVIAVANESVLLIHENAFVQQQEILVELQRKTAFPLRIIEVANQQIPVADAVATYLFNSQLITQPDTNKMMLISPVECQTNQKVNTFLTELLNDSTNPINQVHFFDLKQSMRNGGGPACLRLRIPLTENELNAMHKGILVNNHLLDKLDSWVIRHYRNHLQADDLRDPDLINECLSALDELSQILQLGSIYPFQRG